MSTSPSRDEPRAIDVEFTADDFAVTLSDGRKLVVPLAWFPRLLEASDRARSNWEILGDGEGLRWPDIDEDISVAGLLRGSRSAEAQRPDVTVDDRPA